MRADLCPIIIRYKLIYEKKRCETMKEFEMGEQVRTTGNRNRHAIFLGLIGIILIVVGELIVNVRGMPFRGSGLGTIAFWLGVVLLLIAVLRFFYKRPK